MDDGIRIYGARHISATCGSPAWPRHDLGSQVAELCQAPHIPRVTGDGRAFRADAGSVLRAGGTYRVGSPPREADIRLAPPRRWRMGGGLSYGGEYE